jgi:hypothetical protein
MATDPSHLKARPGQKDAPKAAAEPNLVMSIVAKHGANDAAVVRALYLETLARKPTDRELKTCSEYIQGTTKAKGTRTEAFEDILKALINTAEFRSKR